MEKKINPHRLTAENGRPIADNQNIQTAGRPGPVTLQDPWFIEKLAHFDREVIPERRMHAKGAGAWISAHPRQFFYIYPYVDQIERNFRFAFLTS